MLIEYPAPGEIANALRRMRVDPELRADLVRHAQHATRAFAAPALPLKLHEALDSCTVGGI